MKIIRNA